MSSETTKPGLNGLVQIAQAFAQTRYRTRAGLSRAAFEAWRDRAVADWLRRDVQQVRYYRDLPPPKALSDLPIVDKATLMADFGAFNRGEIDAQAGWAAFAQDGRIGDVSVGASTGTSGNRALYVITPAERYRWLGTILAKALPQFPWRSERVAVVLPQSSSLYETAARARRLSLKFFNLRNGLERWADALAAYDPTVLIGPPRILRVIAEEVTGLRPRMVYSGAETIDPIDRAAIANRFGFPPGEIYMATEGLFGVTCSHGRLHLAEDAVHFEFEDVGDGLVNPLVTNFRRQFQVMARYRMNDLLRLSPEPCPCGSPLLAVDEVVGRMDDIFEFGAPNGADPPVRVTPDIMRNAVLDADRQITDFRIHRVGPEEVVLLLPPEATAEAAQSARAALGALLDDRRPGISLSVRHQNLGLDTTRKLRRVENIWQGPKA